MHKPNIAEGSRASSLSVNNEEKKSSILLLSHSGVREDKQSHSNIVMFF